MSLIEWVIDRPGLRLGLGDSVNYAGDADLVFSHLYGPLPKQLIGKPAIVNVFGNKKAKAEEWCGAELVEVSKWGRKLTNTIYVANTELPYSVDLSALIEDEGGWFPIDLCVRMIECLGRNTISAGDRVFDGFMGRGTVGMACQQIGLAFVGIDRNPARVQIAREYLGC